MAPTFETTRWSIVRKAGERRGTASRAALAELCEAYWYPVFAYVRGRGHGEDRARDLTQAYFAALLDKEFLRDLHPDRGRFRSFLLVSIRNFLSHERDHERARKRGGGVRLVPLEIEDLERRIGADRSGEPSPERAFEIRWALTLVRRTMLRLEREFAEAGRQERFGLLRGFLMDDGPSPSYEQLAERLGLSVGAIKSMVLRLRKRFGSLLRAEVEQTIEDGGDVDAELRHLLQVLETR